MQNTFWVRVSCLVTRFSPRKREFSRLSFMNLRMRGKWQKRMRYFQNEAAKTNETEFPWQYLSPLIATIISVVETPVAKSWNIEEFRREAFDVVNKGASGAISGVMTNKVYEGRFERNLYVRRLGGWKVRKKLEIEKKHRQKINKNSRCCFETKLVWKMLLNLFPFTSGLRNSFLAITNLYFWADKILIPWLFVFFLRS